MKTTMLADLLRNSYINYSAINLVIKKNIFDIAIETQHHWQDNRQIEYFKFIYVYLIWESFGEIREKHLKI